jgi:ribonuclease R
MGFVVVVELTQRPTRRTKAVGKIVEVLGDNMGTGMAVDMALRTHEIPTSGRQRSKNRSPA